MDVHPAGTQGRRAVVKTWPGLSLFSSADHLCDPWGHFLHVKNGDHSSTYLRGLLRLKADNVGKAFKIVPWW